jgi:hypothetical protein
MVPPIVQSMSKRLPAYCFATTILPLAHPNSQTFLEGHGHSCAEAVKKNLLPKNYQELQLTENRAVT